jgi:hypothetical protein
LIFSTKWRQNKITSKPHAARLAKISCTSACSFFLLKILCYSGILRSCYLGAAVYFSKRLYTLNSFSRFLLLVLFDIFLMHRLHVNFISVQTGLLQNGKAIFMWFTFWLPWNVSDYTYLQYYELITRWKSIKTSELWWPFGGFLFPSLQARTSNRI